MLIHTSRITANRRQFFNAAIAAGGLFFIERGLFAQALTLTASTTEGPYYPDRLPLDQDNDLLVVNNNITPALGTITWMSGRILDRNGDPIRNAIVEIWQADNYGSYIHSNGVQNGRRDGNFQGYGVFETASDGRYLFRTIKPGLYPGRVRHVHCKVTLPSGRSLTTQLHIQGETSASDNVLSAIRDPAQLASVIRPWTAIEGSPIGALAVNWDVVMDFTPSDTGVVSKPTLAAAGAVVNGASFRRGAVSAGWLTITGRGLSSTTRTWVATDIVDGRLPESLDGVSVRINNQPAPVYYVSPNQINVLAPDSTVEGNVAVTVTNATGTSDAVSTTFSRLMPSLFTFPGEYAAAVKADGNLSGPAGLISGVTTVPARPGESIMLFGTGFGPTTPAIQPGMAVTEPAQTSTPVTVRIDAQDAVVSYAGLTSAGLYQLNVNVPDNLADGDYPVTAEVGGVRTGKFAKLRVEKVQSARMEKHPRLKKEARRELLALLHRIRGSGRLG